jgi:hypothetical protein
MKIREEGRKTGGVARYIRRSQETTKLRAEAQRAAAVPSTNTLNKHPLNTPNCLLPTCAVPLGGEEEKEKEQEGLFKAKAFNVVDAERDCRSLLLGILVLFY